MNQKWLPLIILAPFLKGCVFPTWSSALELGFVCALVVTLNLIKEKPIKGGNETELEDLKQKISTVNSQLQSLKIKIGFKTPD